MKRLLRIFSVVAVLTGFYTQADAQNGSGLPEHWQNIPKTDTGIVNAAVFSVGTKAYIIGGDTSGEYGVRKKYSNKVYVYDSMTNSWSKTTPFPGKPRIGAVAFSVGTKGYYGLGQDSTGYMTVDTVNFGLGTVIIDYYRRTFLRDWWEFNTLTQTWTRLNDFPGRGRSFASSFVIRNYNGTFVPGFVYGMTEAYDGGDPFAFPPVYPSYKTEYLDTVYGYNVGTDSWYGFQAPGGGRANAVAIPTDSGKLFMGLGDKGVYNEYLVDWWEYNTNVGAFTQRNNFPSEQIPSKGKVNSGTFSFGSLAFVVCGFNGNWTKHVYQYDGSEHNWQQYPDYRDSGRANGVSWMIGAMGYYGHGFRPLSEELATSSKFYIDTATIRLYGNFPDTICASSNLVFNWSSGKTFAAGNNMRVQMSDSVGIYTWPPLPASIIASFPVTGANGSLVVPIPEWVAEGRKYRVRLISDNPFLLGRSSPEFFVKSNPIITYRPTIHPLMDTVCENADYILPTFVVGTARNTNGKLSFQWRKDGVPLVDGPNISGSKTDTLKLVQAQLSQSGNYDVIILGDCYPDTSLPYQIKVEAIPQPVITFQPGDTIVNKKTSVCEFSDYRMRGTATGRRLNFMWYKNGQPMELKGNIIGINTNEVVFSPILATDSGWYKLKISENCGAYIYTDSFFVEVHEIARIVSNPKNVSNVFEGTDQGFKVSATGYDLKYSWRMGLTPLTNSSKYTGTDTDTLTVLDVKIEDVEFYSVVVTGGCPQVAYSNLAILDVIASPKIEREPKDTIEVCEGASGSMNILASGSNLTFQWWQGTPPTGGSAIPATDPNFSGEKTRTLEFQNVTGLNSGLYYCVVSNGVGTPAVSRACYLKVNPIPSKPGITRIYPNVLRSNLQAETYIWFFNGRYMANFSGLRQIPVPDSLEGDWTVQIIIKDCVSPVSDPYAYLLSVNSVQNSHNLDIYPNPTVNTVKFELNNLNSAQPVDVYMYDITGKLVMTFKDVDTENVELNVSGLNAGMYVVNIRTEDKVFTGKFIKQ